MSSQGQTQARRAHPALQWLCLVLGALLLFLGSIAGWLNHTVVNGEQFGQRVDAVRQDPEVARQVGALVAQQVVAEEPDLVAVAPLITSLATSVVGSPALSRPFETSVEELHDALTRRSGGEPVLRLADLGATLTAALRQLSPDLAAKIPPDLAPTLADFGAGETQSRIVTAFTWVKVLAWVLPLLGILALVGSVFAAPSRRQGFLRAGVAVAVAAGLIGLVAIIGQIAVSFAPNGDLQTAVAQAAWAAFGVSLWTPILVLGLVGGAVAIAAAAVIPEIDLGAIGTRARGLLVGPLPTTWQTVVRAVLIACAGAFAVLRPADAARLLAALVGLALVLLAVSQVAAVASRAKSMDTVPAGGAPTDETAAADGRSDRRLTWTAVTIGAVSVIGLLGFIFWQGRPGPDSTVPTAVAQPVAEPTVCNGHSELCARPYNEVAFPAAHNAMSAADLPGWYLAEQPTSLVGALDAGVRVLLFDTWYGQTTANGVITSTENTQLAEDEASATFGPEVYGSMQRVIASVQGTPTGPVEPFMCHTLCELGATNFEDSMRDVKRWMDAHPQEVVSMFIQDVVTPADTAAVMDRVGLSGYAFTPPPIGQPWPTLGQMISSNKRLVVLMEKQGGGQDYPWLAQGFDYVQETPYTFETAKDFSCAPNRGQADSPLFQVNHWLAGFTHLVTDAREVNAEPVLWPRLEKCQAERGMIPNFVAVNYYNEGDLFGAVDRLNKVGKWAPDAG